MSNENYKFVELGSLKMEDGAKELMSAPEMQPYLRHIEAFMIDGDFQASMHEIAELPLEKRYIWADCLCAQVGIRRF